LFGRQNIIVVGGNAAGPAAAAKAKRVAPDNRVIMFEAGKFISTGTCELPYVLSGEIKNYSDIVFFNAESFRQKKGVEVFTSHLVEQIDRRNRKIIVRNINDNTNYQFDYDKLILATGSSAKRFPFINKLCSNHFTLKSVADYLLIKDYLDNNKVSRVLIVGAGYIGVEASEAFKKLGMEVTLLEKSELPMPGYDDDVRKLILNELLENNVEFYGDTSDIKFLYDGNKISGINLEGRILDYDLILTAIGIEPNNNLAFSTRLDTGEYGGLKTDRRQRTSDPNIFAAGDNTELINKITNRPDYMPIATFAYSQGHVAGANAAGGNEFSSPVVKNVAVKIFNKVFVAVGLSLNEAVDNRFNTKSVFETVGNLVHVMPQSGKVFGKIIYDLRSGFILGASFLGHKEAIGFGDMISSFIHNKIEAHKLADVNFNYTPPYSPFINLLSVLGRKVKKGMK